MTYEINIGDRFGRLKVTKEFNKNGNTHFTCVCDCGNTVSTRKHRLLKDKQTRCVHCLRYNGNIFPIPKYSHKLRKVYYSAKARCDYKTDPKYYRYGARGIKFMWNSIYEFLNDMGEPPKGLTLDRIDNDGNYCKENCRWATNKEQANNRSTNRYLTMDGITKNITQWGDEYKLPRNCISKRIKRGWSVENAIKTPLWGVGTSFRRKSFITNPGAD
jgi:hypothetical protein